MIALNRSINDVRLDGYVDGLFCPIVSLLSLLSVDAAERDIPNICQTHRLLLSSITKPGLLYCAQVCTLYDHLSVERILI